MNIINTLIPYGATISLLGLVVAIIIFLKQRRIYRRQVTILKDVEKTVAEVNDITTRLKTDELLDNNVKNFFQIKDEYASGYKCLYPHIDNKDQTVIPDIRLGDSFSVLTLKSLLEIKNHPFKLFGVDRDAGEPGCCQLEDAGDEYQNCIIVCSHMLDNDHDCPFPEPSDISEKFLEEEKINNTDFPCWFVRGKRNLVHSRGEGRSLDEVSTVAIVVDGVGPIFSSIDYLYRTNRHDSSKVYEDFGILSRVRYKDNYYILAAGIHNIGSWLVVEYLRKVIFGDIEAPEGFLDDKDFIAVIEGDYSPNKRWIENVELKHGYYWHKPSGSSTDQWVKG